MMSLSQRLAQQTFDYRRPNPWGARFRQRRVEALLGLVDAAYAERGKVELLDVGGIREYWGIVPEEYLEARDVRITLVNLPGDHASVSGGRFTFVPGDACDLAGFDDRSFDVVHSNSVVEHVGDWAKMTAYAREVARLADRYYVQAPNFWFPIEPHAMTPFLHWVPKPLRVRLVMRFGFGHWRRQPDVASAVRRVDSARLLSGPMFAALFPGAEIRPERLGPFTKSWIAVRGADRTVAAA
jgi:hypothetical protein